MEEKWHCSSDKTAYYCSVNRF